MTVKKSGKVYLVGAGPGDPTLITVRATQVLATAEVVLYDRLVHPEILHYAPAAAQRIYVGKEPYRQLETRQEFINAQLIHFAKKDFKVVRLKGGDPFIFGRGSEEALALRRAGVEFEFVPGISSSMAVPMSAMIPLTHRGVAASFGVFSGHGAENGSGLDWDLAALQPTAVFLMGVQHLPDIVRHLRKRGRLPGTPVAVIENGTLANERIVTGTLENIIQRSQHLGSPAVIVVGEVVQLREKLCQTKQELALSIFPEQQIPIQSLIQTIKNS